MDKIVIINRDIRYILMTVVSCIKIKFPKNNKLKMINFATIKPITTHK